MLKEPDDSLPFIYPAVLVLYPNMCLFGAAKYPFPAIGSVHVYNKTKMMRKLTSSEDYTCVLQVDDKIRQVINTFFLLKVFTDSCLLIGAEWVRSPLVIGFNR